MKLERIEVNAKAFGDGGSQWILANARNIYSQYGEDGMLRAVFEQIGTKTRYVVDVGCGDGVTFSNSRQWIELGWRGLLIDADEQRATAARIVTPEPVHVEHLAVSASDPSRSLDAVLSRHNVPHGFDLLTIDIDGQDWHVWNQMLRYRPRVVCIEHNTREAKTWYVPLIDGEGQAGADALALLAAGKQYSLLFRTFTNSVFIEHEAHNATPN